MTEQRIKYLFERYFTDSCTEDERLEFLSLIHEGQQDEALLKVMQECWDTYAPRERMPAGAGEKVFRRIVRPAPRAKYIRWAASAAAVLMACLAFVYFFKRKPTASAPIVKAVIHDVSPGGNRAILTLVDGSTVVLDSAANGKVAQQGDVEVLKSQDGKLNYKGAVSGAEAMAYNTVSTPYGGKYQVTLIDGTKVWLNAVSSLTFPTAFTGATREVSLKGEAYFEVAPHAAQPFVVKVGDMKVQVLGTHFNIMAYDEEDAIRTTLLEGAVKVAAGGVSKPLAVGEQGVWDKRDKLEVLQDVDVEEAVAWKNGFFQFNSTGLQVIMRQVARWYNVKVVYAGEGIKGESFSGSIPSNEHVSQVLKMLEMTGTVHFDVTDRVITVHGK